MPKKAGILHSAGGETLAERGYVVAKAYHNLSGLCRDLRAVALAAAEGDTEAYELCVAFDDAMELHDAVVSGDLDAGSDSDAATSGDDAEDESDTPPRGERGRGERVGAGGAGPAVHSTRARTRRENAPRGQSSFVAVRAGEPHAPRPRNGGKR